MLFQALFKIVIFRFSCLENFAYPLDTNSSSLLRWHLFNSRIFVVKITYTKVKKKKKKLKMSFWRLHLNRPFKNSNKNFFFNLFPATNQQPSHKTFPKIESQEYMMCGSYIMFISEIFFSHIISATQTFSNDHKYNEKLSFPTLSVKFVW